MGDGKITQVYEWQSFLRPMNTRLVTKSRGNSKFNIIRIGPYGTDRALFADNVDIWSSITSIHVGMFLMFSPSPCTGDDLLNYKRIDQSFLSGWVREILVKAVDENTAKVNILF